MDIRIFHYVFRLNYIEGFGACSYDTLYYTPSTFLQLSAKLKRRPMFQKGKALSWDKLDGIQTGQLATKVMFQKRRKKDF